MAEIVVGLGTSHSPMLSTPPEMWADRLEGDRRIFAEEWDDLVAERSAWIGDHLSPSAWREKHRNVQLAIDRLAAELEAARPDVVLIVGDDQEEMFPGGLFPPVAVFSGEEAVDDPPDVGELPEFRRASLWAFYDEVPRSFQCSSALGRHLVHRLMDSGFDVTTVDGVLPGCAIGHAFTFVERRLMRGRPLPLLPVMLNTFFPRSQPSAERAFSLGQALHHAVQAWPESLRVAVVASGGLSHRLVDEDFDRTLLAAMEKRDAATMIGFPEEHFRRGDEAFGTGESKNWIAVAGMMEETSRRMELLSYEPLYRTEAGTGVGAAFVCWQ